MASSPVEPPTLSPSQLAELLARARGEQWSQLALVSPSIAARSTADLIRHGWPADRVFRLSERLGADGARALASLTSLTSLNLDYNDIGDDGARALVSLTSLTWLDLMGNSIGVDGARALASLTSLTSLNLWANHIGVDGARALASLTSLTSLILWANHIGDDGARALATLTSLTSLHLADNGIGADGARALATLTSLTWLDLGNNRIGDDGARALASLTNLTSLNLMHTGIEADGARALASLTNLTSLDLKANFIGADGARALLEAWADAPRAEWLKLLDLRGIGELTGLLPAEVIVSTDAQAILAAYRRYRAAQRQQALRPLNEAKLLVVGNEAVGKTSLIRYLVDGTPRNPDEPKTAGTAIRERIETRDWTNDDSPVTLHVWDFGGQLVMHGTHRYFLTERSLYLLVLEDRREDDRSHYDWLKTIHNRGGDSPVIVVINKSDPQQDPALSLDEPRLRKDYPGIIGVVRTSCDPGKVPAASIAALRQLIIETLAHDPRLKHVRDPLPNSWLRVKLEVARLARQSRVLKLQDFVRLCERPTDGKLNDESELITDEAEQRALLRLLHDLGAVVAHGLERDAPAALREITLLDPNWLTGAVYTLLNSPQVKDQDGEFGRDQLPELLDPTLYPPQWYEFILNMMQDDAIGLCFELPGSRDRDRSERYLIPEALSPNEREYGMFPPDSLRFRVQYLFLPPGLLPRFIVQSHRNLTDKPTRWRTGVVLGAADCLILVRADRDNHRMEITVAGPAARKRSALSIVLDDLDEVHARNLGTEPRPLVPLPEQPDAAVSYEHLLKLEARYGLDHEFDPEDADRPYTVRELLEGVRREGHRDGRPVRGDQDEWLTPSIRAGDNAQITLVQGQVRTQHGDVNVGQRTPGEQPKPSWLAAFSSWPFFSVACGIGAVLLAIVLLLIPSNEWRAIIGGLAGLGLGVTAFMLSLNPAHFYRRMLCLVIPGGLLTNALGVSVDASVLTRFGIGWLRWDSTVSGWFFVAWAAVVGILAWRDWTTTNNLIPSSATGKSTGIAK